MSTHADAPRTRAQHRDPSPAPLLPPLRLGGLEVPVPVVLAPMAGVTDAAFRILCRRHGAGLYVNQMVTARALVEGHRRSLEMAAFAPGEWPRSIQLYGTEPASIAEAVRRLLDDGVEHIDLNFGCPMKKVTRQGGGAALPWKRRLYRAIVAAAVRAAGEVPVTVKFRLGIDRDHLTHLDAGRIAADEGAAAVTLHARTAEQLYAGRADWDRIGELKATLDIPVLGNGDIWEAADAVAMVRRTGADGVVVGRGCLGRPWLFADLAAAFAGRPLPPRPALGAVVDEMLEHARLLVTFRGPERGIKDFRKHTGWYLKGFPVGSETRRRLNQVGSMTELETILGGLDPTVPFPVDGMRLVRGHHGPPRPVSLPEGWLTDRDDEVTLAAEALVAAGGG
ncbi:MAG: tRNA dihydrouridine synthase DusB [Actinomyces sp.]|nr:MAG: tRNA dihydrouridine synthase DusB [Actinomyces sp.]